MKDWMKIFVNSLSIAIFVMALSFFIIPNKTESATDTDGVNVELIVIQCNNDSICGPGEDYDTCPNDCDPPTPSVPGTPTFTGVTETSLTFMWSSSTYADYYTIERCLGSGCSSFIQIATTSSSTLTYTDTGLSEDSLYRYRIKATNSVGVDGSYSSVGQQATNPVAPPPTPPSSSGVSSSGGSRNLDFDIYNIRTAILDGKAYVTWETSVPTLSSLYWGNDQDYSIASYSGTSFEEQHLTIINNVYDGQYFFLIKSISYLNRVEYSDVERFFVNESNDYNPPPSNPTNFRDFLVGDNQAIGLAWNNPDELDFSRVRIVREERGFPSTYLDGHVVYEGGGQSVVDQDVEYGKTYYYSIFAIDEAGNVSSGVVLKVVYLSEDEKEMSPDDKFGEISYPTEPDEDIGEGQDSQDDQDETSDQEKGDPIDEDEGEITDYTNAKFFPIDFYTFRQNGASLEFNANVIVLDSQKPFEILIDEKYIKTREEVVAYFDTNKTGRIGAGFKFEHLPNSDVYRASVPALDTGGEIPFVIRVYDRFGAIQKDNRGIISLSEAGNRSGQIGLFGYYIDLIKGLNSWILGTIVSIIILIPILILFIFFILTRDRDEEEEEKGRRMQREKERGW